MKISKITGRELLDSRAFPTVEAEVLLDNDIVGSAIVPSGASTGKSEAFELRDSEPDRWIGKGVRKAVSNINFEINDALRGKDADVNQVDDLLRDLDGTPNKKRLGANAILAVSLANARAISESRKIPLYELVREISDTDELSIPTPMVNIISGGLHAQGNLDIQDFLVIPVGASSFREALDWVGKIYHSTKQILNNNGYSTLLADEGGFSPKLKSHSEALDILNQAIQVSGLVPKEEISIAIDVASSHFYKNGIYNLTTEGLTLHPKDMIHELANWCSRYPILSIEDGCAEEDWEGWKMLTEKLGSEVQLIGDDLFTTSVDQIRKGKMLGVANAVLIKLNQIGTLSETVAAIKLCREIGYAPVISARSGETEDTFIADLAVGSAAGQIKIGSIARSERTAKYNQLLRLEEKLGGSAKYCGRESFSRFVK